MMGGFGIDINACCNMKGCLRLLCDKWKMQHFYIKNFCSQSQWGGFPETSLGYATEVACKA